MNIKQVTASGLMVAGLALGGSALAQSQDSGFYIGTGVGYANYDLETPAVTGLRTFSSDSSGTGWKIFAGYQITRNWGVEAGYVDFGSIGFNGTAAVGAVTGTFTGSVDVSAWTLALTGTMPMNQDWDLTGKLGAYNWRTNNASGTVSVPGVGTAAITAANDNGTDVLVGIGVRYNINKNLGIHADWEYFGGNDTINFFSIGLRYKF